MSMCDIEWLQWLFDVNVYFHYLRTPDCNKSSHQYLSNYQNVNNVTNFGKISMYYDYEVQLYVIS